jgi:hypothetical protein
MKFLRHVGKHGDRKVAVIFREVPGEPHMCLVTHTELLNQHIHDPMMKCIESDIGQNSEDLADALNRTFTNDGRPILQVLHVEGQLKKVNTENIVMTPQPNVKIKLSELNKILDEMKQGEAAVRKLESMDQSLGLQDPKDVIRRMRGENIPQKLNEGRNTNVPPVNNAQVALDDSSIASNLRSQALKMSAEAKGLMAEADRLLKEAEFLEPQVAAKLETPEPVKAEKPKTRRTRSKVVA